MRWKCLFILTFASVVAAQSPPDGGFRVGLVLDKGGKDDKSFNSAAYEGATRATKDLGVSLKYVEATDFNALENLHRKFARDKYDLIIGVGFAQGQAVKKVSGQFPEAHFAVVDANVTSPNVKALLFSEHEGSYLVGVIAAMKSQSKKIGFVGGMDIPLIRRFAMGFAAGVHEVNPNIKITENFIGVSGEAWNNPAKAKELALSQISSGVDIIFAAAGASGMGVFDAVEEKGKFAIGVDSNQNWVKPGFILTSMLKRVDEAVYAAIKEATLGNFKAGPEYFSLSNKGVDYALDSYNQKLIDATTLKKVDSVKNEIIAGKIAVPDYYKLKK